MEDCHLFLILQKLAHSVVCGVNSKYEKDCHDPYLYSNSITRAVCHLFRLVVTQNQIHGAHRDAEVM